jgi:hypothetical protein
VEFGYRMTLTFHNISGGSQPITIVNFEISGKTTTDVDPRNFTVANGDSTKTFIVQSTTSSQRYATVTYIVDGQTVSTVVDFGSFAPCKCDPKDADASDLDSNCS